MASDTAAGSALASTPSGAQQKDSAQALLNASSPQEGGSRDGSFLEPRSLSTFGAFMHITKINWGVGMMSMPYYLYEAGLWVGIAFFLLSMVLTCISVRSLIRCRHAVEETQPGAGASYTQLTGAVLGNWGRAAAVFSIAIANWGSCVAYAKWTGDNLEKFLPEAGFSSVSWIVIATVFWSLAALLVDDVSFLKNVSFLGLACGQAFVVVVIAFAATSTSGGEGVSFSEFVREAPAWGGLANFNVAMGIAVFCNEGMVIVTPQVQTAMKNPGRYYTALISMCVYFTLNYMVVAVAGYYLRFPKPQAEMTLDFSPSNAVLRAAVYLYALQLAMSFIIVYFVAYTAAEGIVDEMQSSQSGISPRRLMFLKKTGRVLGVISAAGIAVLVRSFGDYIAFMGAIANSLGIYLLPNIGFLRLHARGLLKGTTYLELGMVWCIVVFGAVTGVIATGASFWDLVSGKD